MVTRCGFVLTGPDQSTDRSSTRVKLRALSRYLPRLYADRAPSLEGMKINLNIKYEVNAEDGETKAEEDQAMELIAGEVEGFAERLVAQARAAGMNARMEGD